MACPTRTGRAEKGAGYSFWASHRESLEEATPTNPVLPMSREQGSPYWVARQRTQKGLRESSGPELAGRARPRRPWLSAPPWERFPFPSLGSQRPQFPRGTRAGTAHTSRPHSSLLHTPCPPSGSLQPAHTHRGASRSPQAAEGLWARHPEDSEEP